MDGLAFDDPEADLDEVEPGPGVGVKWAWIPGVRGEPVADLDLLAGRVVVHHQVQLTLRVGQA